MAVKLTVTLSSNNNGINFNAEIDNANKNEDIEETLIQCLLAACLGELNRLKKESHDGDS